MDSGEQLRYYFGTQITQITQIISASRKGGGCGDERWRRESPWIAVSSFATILVHRLLRLHRLFLQAENKL
jgi:hypothetical protein